VVEVALLQGLVDVSKEAGRAVLEAYRGGDFGVSYKEDRSPLTLADRRSNEIILEGLSSLAPDIPVLSEEGRDVPHAERRGWSRFFLVDPLDGTKEFISGNGEFTVNIALIEEGRPVMGVIFVPTRDAVYYAAKGQGACRQEGAKPPKEISVGKGPTGEGLVVAASRSHGSGELEDYLKALRVGDRISAGSSLKFCLVAEGAADMYPRFGPTWEWDTAAGHALVLEAGGLVTDTRGREELRYNKQVPKHPGFIAWGSVRPSTVEAYKS
jgi:3'(2'), 5'-bisphosphate nucleotidase